MRLALRIGLDAAIAKNLAALGRKLDNGGALDNVHDPLLISNRILRGDFDA